MNSPKTVVRRENFGWFMHFEYWNSINHFNCKIIPTINVHNCAGCGGIDFHFLIFELNVRKYKGKIVISGGEK